MPRNTAEFLPSISALQARQWNALGAASSPFMRHEFLAALERTGCVGPETGWQPRYLVLRDAKGPAAAVASFIKTHSYGEFVFDFAWARAYERVGRRYYPKLTIAAPFTPATGPRLLIRPGVDRAAYADQLLAELEQRATAAGISSVHALFVDEEARAACETRGWLLRRDCQFHWVNRGYADFEAYLASFTAEKRKKVRRERRRVEEAGVTFQTRLGGQIDGALLARIHALHRDTFLRHGHEPYLSLEFFGEITRTMPDALMVKLAMFGGTPVAAAIFFIGDSTLYGRYWGAQDNYHSLHFETCYHQGVQFCIERGLTRFEPGTQGEHKVSRGFEPAFTWSGHYIADANFRAAIADYLAQEGAAVEAYAHGVQEHVPYRGRREAGPLP